MSFTKCCNLKYIGENHNPVYRGVCRNCLHGLFDVFDVFELLNNAKVIIEGLNKFSKEEGAHEITRITDNWIDKYEKENK